MKLKILFHERRFFLWIVLGLLAVCLYGILFCTPAWASSKKTYGDVEAVVLEVHDGDTLKVKIDSWPSIIGDGIGVRVYGVDCRELKSGAIAAKDVVKKWIPEGSKVWLSGIRRDKYFRILASVGYNCEYDKETSEFECTDLSEQLLEHQLAVPYFGEKKQAFPKEIK